MYFRTKSLHFREFHVPIHVNTVDVSEGKMISDSRQVIEQFRVSVLERKRRLGGVILLDSIPALQALTGTMACIRSDTRQVICQLNLSAGARGGTGSGGLCL